MKKIFLLVICILFAHLYAYAEDIVPHPSVIKVSHSNFDYAKTYQTNSENLFYLLLSALNDNNYAIEEIQFKTGSVLFKAYTKEFLASIASQDNNNSFIKIIPVDNNYNFSPILIQKLHKYIEDNNNILFKKVI